MTKAVHFFSLLLLAVGFFGCAHTPGDRCYLEITRYNEQKEIFLKTGSMQRVEQSMEELKWAECEREQLRYQLAKDLNLDSLTASAPANP